jgi:hypothetical protein
MRNENIVALDELMRAIEINDFLLNAMSFMPHDTYKPEAMFCVLESSQDKIKKAFEVLNTNLNGGNLGYKK